MKKVCASSNCFFRRDGGRCGAELHLTGCKPIVPCRRPPLPPPRGGWAGEGEERREDEREEGDQRNVEEKRGIPWRCVRPSFGPGEVCRFEASGCPERMAPGLAM